MERIIGNLNCIEAATKEWRSDASALHPAANNDNADANDNNNGNAADNTDNELLMIQMKITDNAAINDNIKGSNDNTDKADGNHAVHNDGEGRGPTLARSANASCSSWTSLSPRRTRPM